MNPAALRTLSKINSNALQNSRRFFSFRFEMSPRVARESTSAAEEAAAPPMEEAPPAAAAFRYNVCQPRTSPVERPSTVGDITAAQRLMVKTAIEEQHLQPAMMPEYYQKRMERTPYVSAEPEPSEEARINKGHNAISERRFQVSKTHANATFPLKSVKLANPFPEPVKMMMSRTVSDDEKAEQMLAESRSHRHFSDWSSKSHHPPPSPAVTAPKRTLMTGVLRRWFSSEVGSDPDKCKKMGARKKKAGCPRMTLKGCPPKARTSCTREPKEMCPGGKKQEAPYPAYSEFCHEDPYEKPSECRMCPWSPEEHPTFKPPKKKFHTDSGNRMRRTGLEVEEEEAAAAASSVEEQAPLEAAEQAEEGMLCDLRKPPCERPKNRRCPPGSTEKKDKKKKKQKKQQDPKQKQKQKKKKKKKANASLAELLMEEDEEAAVVLPPPQPVGECLPEAMSLKKQEKRDKCKVRKFKFPKCNEPRRKPQIVDKGGCPPRKKRKPMVDCPPDEEKGCKTEGAEQFGELRLSGEDRVNKDKRKCPKIDYTVDIPDEEEEGPCPPKKKDGTRICPGDLLKKKRRTPKKKASDVITPAKSNNGPPSQPELTARRPF